MVVGIFVVSSWTVRSVYKQIVIWFNLIFTQLSLCFKMALIASVFFKLFSFREEILSPIINNYRPGNNLPLGTIQIRLKPTGIKTFPVSSVFIISCDIHQSMSAQLTTKFLSSDFHSLLEYNVFLTQMGDSLPYLLDQLRGIHLLYCIGLIGLACDITIINCYFTCLFLFLFFFSYFVIEITNNL